MAATMVLVRTVLIILALARQDPAAQDPTARAPTRVPDVSGTWMLSTVSHTLSRDVQSGVSNIGIAIGGRSVHITQTSTKLVITRAVPGGEVAFTVAVDGSESTNIVETAKNVSTMSFDETHITIDSKTGTLRTKQILSVDGNDLVVETIPTFVGQTPPEKMVMTYKRQ